MCQFNPSLPLKQQNQLLLLLLVVLPLLLVLVLLVLRLVLRLVLLLLPRARGHVDPTNLIPEGSGYGGDGPLGESPPPGSMVGPIGTRFSSMRRQCITH